MKLNRTGDNALPVRVCATVLGLCAITCLLGQATAPDTVVLTIGSTKITAAQYNALVDDLPAQFQAYARGPGKRQFAESLIQLNILSEAAAKLGLDKNPRFQEQFAFKRREILANAFAHSLEQTITVDQTQLQAYYDAHKNEYETVRARQILILLKLRPGKPDLTDEQALAKAQEIRKKLTDGGDFAAIARAESDDPISAAQGGELGEFQRGSKPPALEQAALSLRPGEISEPVKSPLGYHIIQVEERRVKSLAEAKPDIEKKLRPELARKQMEELRAKTPVTINESFFGPAAEAAPPPVK